MLTSMCRGQAVIALSSAQAERGPATAHLNLRNLAADVRELREAHEGSWWKEKLRDANGMFVWSGRKQPNNDPRRLTHMDSVARQSHGAFARSLERILRHPVAELVIIGAALLSAGILGTALLHCFLGDDGLKFSGHFLVLSNGITATQA